MKMIYKMIAAFSFLAILTTALNSIYFYTTRIADLDQRTNEHLTALSIRVLSEIEQYVQVMDYAIDSLAADTEFMEAFFTAAHLDDDSDIGQEMSVQNIMARKLYREPILTRFYRASAYSRNGFFISSRRDSAGAIKGMTDESKETIDSLSYLAAADATPFHRVITEPHSDPWSVEGQPVFTALRSVAWKGEMIGYVEVSADLSDLVDIFLWQQADGVLVQGIFDDGHQLFRNFQDDIIYADLNQDGMTRVQEHGIDRLVVAQYSDYLGMTVYVSQDMTLYNQQANALVKNYVLMATGILAVTLAFVTLCSLQLTRSIRKLTRRIRHLPVDSMLAHSDEALTVVVTSPRDQEIHKLEATLNHLMIKTRTATMSEIAMQESAWQARMNALQMQINPHFIYNTLNVISAKGMECGSEEIIDICDQFARMLRYATDLRSKTATLGDELQNARRYLQLVKARYEDQLSYEIDVPEAMNRLILPKLALQPIVENALTHGFAGRTDPREVRILGETDGCLLRLTIRDNGNGFSPDSLQRLRTAFRQMETDFTRMSSEGGEHLGLINTYLRLLHASKGTIRMQLHNDCGAVITLTLPINQEENHVSGSHRG